MMKSWIEQPGFPVIDVVRDGGRLFLTQERFTCMPNDSDQTWLIPVTIEFFYEAGNTRQMKALMDGREMTIDIPGTAAGYKLNHRQTGFYIVSYRNARDLADLGRRIQARSLAPEDRWGLQNDFYSLCRRGDVTLDDYLAFLSHYRNEEGFLPLMSIADNLHHSYLIMPDDRKEKIASLARPWFEDILDRIGFEPGEGEKQTLSILREQLIWHCILYGSGVLADFARIRFENLLQGDSIHPDIMKSTLQAGAFTSGETAFDWLDKRFHHTESEHERMNILTALGSFNQRETLVKAQRYVLETVPARNTFVPVTAMAANPFAIPLLWDWYVSNLERIEQFHPMMYERVVGAIVPVAGVEHPEKVSRFFQEYLEKSGKAADVIKLSLERLAINARMRRVASGS
jgi:tricorn protease interacting factor F2/3